MKKNSVRNLALAVGLTCGAAGAVTFASMSSAAQPANPGCFGRDRAAYIQTVQGVGAPGASEVGVILSERAGDNGDINRAYVCQT